MVPIPFGYQNATRLVSGLLLQVSNGLRDAGKLGGLPLPINCH